MYKTHAASGPDDAPQSFILDTNLTTQSSGKEESNRRSGRPIENSVSVVARLEGKRKLSVVERQELRLAKKNIKAAKKQSHIAEKRLQERATSAPDLSRSRQSFRSVPQEKKPALTRSIAVTKRRSSTVARKRSIAAATPSTYLGNISNQSQSETKARKRQRRGPISDPLSQKMR